MVSVIRIILQKSKRSRLRETNPLIFYSGKGMLSHIEGKPTRYFLPGLTAIPCITNTWKKRDFTLKNCLVVEKGTVGGIGDLKGSFANNSEWIIFCQKGRRIFQQTGLMKNRKPPGTVFHRGRKPSREYKYRFNSCWFGEDYPKATYNAAWLSKHHIQHPTVKNVECLSWLIQLSTLPQELVFDPFMGSGSTALAAEKTGRLYCGCEMEEEYCQLIKRRQQGVTENREDTRTGI